ncbi:MAG: hypothetical protein HQ582_04950, partial [Planctomycetes bacterium]|nr:hypothetical protein [Planctomycetota bacterium]
MEAAELKQAAAGREIDILVEVAGIDRDLLDGKHHPCPLCGGSDRLRLVDRGAGALRCNVCFATGCGDFIAAVQKFQGLSFPQAIESIARYLGLDPSANGNGKPKPGSLLKRVAAAKGVSVESLKAYGGHEAQRGDVRVARFPMYGFDGSKCGEFDIG